jgi:hypothetical protein
MPDTKLAPAATLLRTVRDSMSIKILLTLLTSLTVSQVALANKSSYRHLKYYDNDPLTFCTVGVPQDCWLPLDPSTGTYTVTSQHCFNAESAMTFAMVCPKALNNFSSGATPSSEDQDPANASP